MRGKGEEKGRRTNIDWEKIELSISLHFPFFQFLQNFKKNPSHFSCMMTKKINDGQTCG